MNDGFAPILHLNFLVFVTNNVSIFIINTSIRLNYYRLKKQKQIVLMKILKQTIQKPNSTTCLQKFVSFSI